MSWIHSYGLIYCVTYNWENWLNLRHIDYHLEVIAENLIMCAISSHFYHTMYIYMYVSIYIYIKKKLFRYLLFAPYALNHGWDNGGLIIAGFMPLVFVQFSGRNDLGFGEHNHNKNNGRTWLKHRSKETKQKWHICVCSQSPFEK